MHCLLLLPSLQAPGGKAESAKTVTRPFEKPGNTSTLTIGGIQIKISPALEKTTSQTKRAPKTCFKIIGKNKKTKRNQDTL